MVFVDKHRDVDVAFASRGASRPASMQPGETYRGVVAHAVRETAAETGKVSFPGELGHVHPSLRCLVTPALQAGGTEDRRPSVEAQKMERGPIRHVPERHDHRPTLPEIVSLQAHVSLDDQEFPPGPKTPAESP